MLTSSSLSLTFAHTHTHTHTLPVCLYCLSLSLSLSPHPPVAPVLPAEVKAQNLSTSKVQLSWSLPISHSDQQPSSLVVLLTNLTDLSASKHPLSHTSTNVILDVVPGMRYRAVIIVTNEDGEMSTLPIEFRATPSGRSYITSPHTDSCNEGPAILHTLTHAMRDQPFSTH